MSNTELEDGRETGGSGAPFSPPDTRQTAPDTPPSNAHSRRDFLRRASKQAVKEAVEIGSKVVPGGALVRQFVERTDGDDADDALYDPLAIPAKPAPILLKNPLDWFAAWRKGRKGAGE